MDLRRSSLTAERRRRLLSEESGLAPTRGDFVNDGKSTASASAPKKRRTRKERYTPDASWDQQPRITDLVPRRKLVIAAWLVLAALCITGLEWLYAYMPSMAARTTDGRIAAFDLDGEGSLAAYFSSILLFLAGWTAILIFTLRRHRLDDYRARYRIWLWAALAWLTMSLDESGSLHEGFKEFMSYATGSRLYGDGSLWWVLAYAAVLGVIGLRLLWDMRSCRPSTTAISLSAVSFLVAVIVQLDLVMPQSGAKAVMVEEGCEMAGAVFLLLAMVLHARFVIFDIEGKYKKATAVATKQSANSKAKDSPANKQEDLNEPSGADAEQRRGGLLPWRRKSRKRGAPTDGNTDQEKRDESSHRSSAGKRAEKRAAKQHKATQDHEKKQPSPEEASEPQLTRRERKEMARQKKREQAEQLRVDQAEEPKKPRRFGLLRRKPQQEPATATVAASSPKADKKSSSAKSESARSKSNSSSENNGSPDGKQRPLTKAERKALRRERRRKERAEAEG